MANDPELGLKVRQHLLDLGLESPFNPTKPSQEVVKEHFAVILNELGMDLTDDSIRGTPKRLAKMYCEEIFRGLDYSNFPACSTFANSMKADEMVAVVDVEVKSLCEHHAMPFMGSAAIAYIPDGRILGLSKFNRIVDFFASRPQVQERLTEQVSAALQYILGTEDVAVTMQAKHLCVSFRGIKDFCSSTVTSKLAGRFRTEPTLRQEFLALTVGRRS